MSFLFMCRHKMLQLSIDLFEWVMFLPLKSAFGGCKLPKVNICRNSFGKTSDLIKIS